MLPLVDNNKQSPPNIQLLGVLQLKIVSLNIYKLWEKQLQSQNNALKITILQYFILTSTV